MSDRDILILSEESRDIKDIKNKDDNYSVWLWEKLNNYFLSSQKLKLKSKLVFYRLLSTMINAWVTLIKSVTVLESQERDQVLKKILWRFSEELKSWKNLSDCLSLYPRNFSDSEIWMIKAWEKTWKLNTTLKDLADQIEKVNSISWKIKSAMMYPAMILLVVFWVIFVMMTKIVPKLLELFEWNQELPLSTRMLVNISEFFQSYWYLIIAWIIWIVVFVTLWKKTPVWRYRLDLLMLKLPVFGVIYKKTVLSKFSRTLSWLISSWVSIVESLMIVSEAVWNDVYRQRILLLREDVKQWIKIWESLDGDKFFPPIMVQMIQVWEQTAKLDQTIIKVADFYDEEVDNTVWMINKLLEPFIIVFLAVVVWWIALGIIQPIMQMSDVVSQS